LKYELYNNLIGKKYLKMYSPHSKYGLE
jgi:hypothetical protein